MRLASGTHLGPYEILSPIGAGGMGEVYKAKDTRLDRIVAVKVLSAHLSDRPDLRERFEREARAIAALNHPHICTLYDIGRAEVGAPVPSPERERRDQPPQLDTAPPVEDRKSPVADAQSRDSHGAARQRESQVAQRMSQVADAQSRDSYGAARQRESQVEGRMSQVDYLVMEYLEGETVADRLKKGPLPLDQTLRYAIEIADALDKAHRKGITHRDLKPGNIMLTKMGSKLLDFGLTKWRDRQGAAPLAARGSELPTEPASLTADGAILGTLQYMAPEQVEGRTDDIDARTDIFAFGAVVYEMVTGRKAFEGKNQASLIAKILETDPLPITSLQPMTPPALDRVVKKCLAKESEKRWQAASDL